MKVRITFKTPDVLDQVEDFVRCEYDGVDPKSDELIDVTAQAKDVANRFVKWGEYLTVEFDIVSGTAEVIPK